MPQVWVIIVGYRNALEVASCITALRQQTFEDWGVIICENGGQSAFEDLEAALGQGAFFSEKVCAPHIDAVLAIDDPSSEPCLLLHATENLGYAGAISIERETSGPQQVEDVRQEKIYLERILREVTA